MKAFLTVFFTIGLLSTVFCSACVFAADFTESWYLSRGRANMQIGNYKAAIEAYEKVVDKHPDNREAMRGLGIAYEKQGLRDKAIEQFDRYLAKWEDDPEIAFKQAQALEWSRYAYREKDMIKYYRMGLNRKDDPKMRLKYATHLAKRRETSEEAIIQYDKVLASEPGNVDAYRGLAKAYAWLGNNDKALYYSNLARDYVKQEPADMTALRQAMLKGREPTVEGNLGLIVQPDKPFQLYGLRLGSQGKMDVTPFTTATVEAGAEHFRDSSENRTGGYVSIGDQIRFNPMNRFDGILEYHDVTRGDGLEYKFEFTHEADAFTLRPGVKREFRYDSFTALVGSSKTGQLLGRARSTLFYTDLTFESGQTRFDVTPFAGWVSAQTLSKNRQVGLDTDINEPLWQNDRWKLSAEYLLYLTHYAEDQSGFGPSVVEPLPGGYFSPKLFVNLIPRLAAAYVTDSNNEIYVAGGPAMQYIHETAKHSAFRVGGDVHASYITKLPPRFLFKVTADFTQIASVYIRFQTNALLVYTF